jgi:hypothetical protein
LTHKNKLDINVILPRLSLIGNNRKEKEYRLRRKKHNKQKEYNKKEEKLRPRKFEHMI